MSSLQQKFFKQKSVNLKKKHIQKSNLSGKYFGKSILMSIYDTNNQLLSWVTNQIGRDQLIE